MSPLQALNCTTCQERTTPKANRSVPDPRVPEPDELRSKRCVVQVSPKNTCRFQARELDEEKHRVLIPFVPFPYKVGVGRVINALSTAS